MNQGRIGAVVIGRNEGKRLIRCLESLMAHLPPETPIVYVDSGSTDGSTEAATVLGVEVVSLDQSAPFTMARGRNAGFEYLITHHPDLNYVQFIDGDCELLPGWIEQAIATLTPSPSIAILCGRRRERFPEASVYNYLADLEWNTPIGEARACGGDMLARVTAIQAVEGYNPALICGEEPEMCIRLRQQGWTIWRIDADMTLHDAAMHHFSQWWQRSVRAGWAIAQGKAMHGEPPKRYMVRESFSVWLWGIGLPILSIGLIWPSFGLSGSLLLGYILLMKRIYQFRLRQGDTSRQARLYALFCVLSKFPQALGQAKYWLNRWRGKPATLIEYKISSGGQKQAASSP